MNGTHSTGARLLALRELLGLTQVQLADAAGISQARWSKAERDLTDLPDDVLETIAQVTSVPMSFLKAEPVGITEGSLRFRKRSTARRAETKQVVQLAIEAYRACTEIATLEGLQPPELPQALSAEPHSDEIEQLAEATRAALGLPFSGPVPHVTRACERAGIFVVPLRLPARAADAQLLGHDGVSTRRAFFDPALIGYLPGLPGDRLRHTLAHELGHLVLHQPHPDRPPVREAEQEAHRFAAAFLMPHADAREAFAAGGPLTLERFKVMKAGWGIAISALIMRAWHLGVIDDERRRSLYMQMSARKWRKNEPVRVHAEDPLLLYTLLAERFGIPIDWERASDELALPGDILKGLAPAPPDALVQNLVQ